MSMLRALADRREKRPLLLIYGNQSWDRVVFREECEKLKLAKKGLYSGEVNGYMDEQTMEALGVFQRESNLAVSGVPTPRDTIPASS